jgi:hypothetical protein
METWLIAPSGTALAILIAAAALHASFQLGVSVLTGLSAHSLGLHRSNSRTLGLGGAYLLGVFGATLGLALSFTYLLGLVSQPAPHIWAAISGMGIGIGLAVMALYYQTRKGTMLWLPRAAAEYLTSRIGKTRQGFEAFALGVMTGIAELPFILTPLLIVGMLYRGPVSSSHLSALLVYTFIVILPLLVILGLVGSGKKISHIQRWRETNKGFLQASAGAALIAVSLYIFTNYSVGGLLP